MQLDCFPPLTVKHTDSEFVGRVYIPLVNWYNYLPVFIDIRILMIIIILICIGFGTSAHLTNAYGLAGHLQLS